MNYQRQARDFLKKTKTRFLCEHLRYGPYFEGEKEFRNVYLITLMRNGQSYSFEFGQSIADTANNEPLTSYDVLAALTKYDPGDLENFLLDFGYNQNAESLKIGMKIYPKVIEEYKNVYRLFSDVLEELSEIA